MYRWRFNPTTAIPNCAADAQRAELFRTISCSPGIGAEPQQAENAQIRRSGNARFSHMVRHKHCLRLLHQIWHNTSKQCICNTNAQNPSIPRSRNGWVSACWGFAPVPGSRSLFVCGCAIFNRFCFCLSKIYFRKYFRIRYWHCVLDVVYSWYTNKLSKSVRDYNFIFSIDTFRT